jgi:hypothetical protein
MTRSGKLATAWCAEVLLVACASDPIDPIDPVDPVHGLSLVAIDPAYGIAGTYTEDGVAVHFEVIPDPAGDGVSARWTDVDGFSIAIDFSGDPIAYALWADEAPPREVERDRARLLDLVVRGGEALATVDLAPRAARQAQYLRGLAAAIPPPAERAYAATAAELAGAALYANTGTYKQKFRVIDSGIVGAHQCTGWANYYLDTNGTWYFYNQLLNRNGHGDVPACDTQVCSAWSAPHGYKGGGKCSTPYQLCGIYDDRHNCRSDAKWQQNWVMRNVSCSKVDGICDHPQGLFNGAACTASTSCNSGYNLCL